MKESAYSYKTNDLEIEILVDVKRELTQEDGNNLRVHIEGIANSIREETLKLDPETKKKSDKDRADIIAIFSGREIFVEEIENKYIKGSIYAKHQPWFAVTTSKGRIKIGWRKRVINIDWEESTIEGKAEDLFPDEDVTKYDKDIHAWGYDKAKEYIDVLLA